MRVLFVSNMWPPVVVGGAERYAAGLAEELAGGGHEVGVVTFGVTGERVVGVVPDHRLPGGRMEPSWWQRKRFHLADLWNVEARRELRGAITSFRPDVVHSHVTIGMSVAALLTAAPRVHTTHDLWLLCQGSQKLRDNELCRGTCLGCVPFARSRRALVGRRPPLFITPSEKTGSLHVEEGWPAERFRLVRNPMHGPAAAVLRQPRPPGPLRLGYIGQVAAHKGFELLLDALDQLDDVVLVCAGPGPLVEVAEAHPKVEYRGVVGGADKEQFFADIDALVLPSLWHENAPLVIDEAACRGVPVIGSRRGGIPEYVPESCRPLLFEPEGTAGLVDAVRRFASNPGDYPAGPPAGRSWAEHTASVLAVYDEAIAEAR